MHLALETNWTKLVMVDMSNSAGVWGKRRLPMLKRFLVFSKNTHFEAYFSLNFCLKRVFE